MCIGLILCHMHCLLAIPMKAMDFLRPRSINVVKLKLTSIRSKQVEACEQPSQVQLDFHVKNGAR